MGIRRQSGRPSATSSSSTPAPYRRTSRAKLVLDAGCSGNGRYAKLANDWGARIVAVDISSAVEIASPECRRPSLTVDVVQADLFKLPFRPDTFDMACSSRRPAPHAGRQGCVPGDSAAGQGRRSVLDLRPRTGEQGVVRDESLAARMDGEGVLRHDDGGSARCSPQQERCSRWCRSSARCCI